MLAEAFRGVNDHAGHRSHKLVTNGHESRNSQHKRTVHATVSPCVHAYRKPRLTFVITHEASGLGLLGDPTRRAIFELLALGPCSVSELARQLPISRSAVSQHLRLLKDGGLVLWRSEGTRHIYRLNPDGLLALRAYLDRTAIQKAAEANPGGPE